MPLTNVEDVVSLESNPYEKKQQWSATLYQYITATRIGCVWLKRFFSHENELPIRFNQYATNTL